MKHFYLSFSVVFPLFCMMALGFGLRISRVLEENLLEGLNKLCFRVFLPVILFVNVYNSNFREVFSPKLLGFALLCVLLCFCFLMAVVPIFEKENRKRGVIVQGIFRSNYILFGIPVTVSLFGEEKAAVTAILIAFVVPLFNALSVVALECFRSGKIDIRQIVKQVITNPLILGAAAAFFFILSGLRLPELVFKTVTDISKIATPLSLIVLGGTFTFRGLGKSPKALVVCVFAKLILVPAVFLPVSIWIGFRGIELAALLAMFASPTAVSSFTMAQSMGGDEELAGNIVILDSVCSVLTIFFWITFLQWAGFLAV